MEKTSEISKKKDQVDNKTLYQIAKLFVRYIKETENKEKPQ